jgi:methionine synthase I (cobalamin-dependent)
MVMALARQYADAGAKILTTNTFAANLIMMERRRVKGDPAEICRAGVELVRRGAGSHHVWIAGTIGPSGAILAVREVDDERLLSSFRTSAEALSTAGADAIVLETFSELAELLLAVDAVRQATDKPIIACLSFDSGPQRTRTMMGVEASEAGHALDDAGVDVVGFNCGAGITHALPAAVALRAATSRPVWAKPSAGLPELDSGHPAYATAVDEFLAHAPNLLDAGVNVIGGCCGCGPEYVKRLSSLVLSRARAARMH